MTSKIIVQLQGGLGNQLFQVFSGIYLSEKFHMRLVIDESRLITDSSIKTRKSNSIGNGSVRKLLNLPEEIFLRRSLLSFNFISRRVPILRSTFVTASDLGMSSFLSIGDEDLKRVVLNKRNLRLNVTLQHSDYFDLDYIQRYFCSEIQSRIEEKSQLSELIDTAQESAVCAIHVRLGDYLTSASHDLLSELYYEKAFIALSERYELNNIWLFSDDILNAREYLPKLVSSRITRQFGPNDLNTNETLILMASCPMHIISNSTFSLWAAFFSGSEGVAAPLPWFKRVSQDVEMFYPDKWIRVEQ